jgi:hypothetical protein
VATGCGGRELQWFGSRAAASKQGNPAADGERLKLTTQADALKAGGAEMQKNPGIVKRAEAHESPDPEKRLDARRK